MFSVLLVLILGAIVLNRDTLAPGNFVERVRANTRSIEFDFVGWTIQALQVKLNQFALGSEEYLPVSERHRAMQDYLELIMAIQIGESRLVSIYSDPAVSDPEAASAGLRADLADLRKKRDLLGPMTEGLLQDQVTEIVSEMGLSLGGQPVPPVLYHATPLPWALIVSPRTAIRQDADINLTPDLTLEQRIDLEERVDRRLDVSSLVVGIGGVGLYPTMVQETSDLSWLSEVVSHEWVHNFLTLRPLGVSYLSSPQLRTMNETVASIAGKEMGRMLLAKYYPELLPPEPETPPSQPPPAEPQEPPAFDFNHEMHTTRVRVDELLAEGKVEEAEVYMEQRRVFFWDNGYRIRKLNQAYFAFYGAYADAPGGGAAGTDPVGAAVRLFRQKSGSLAEFLNRISWMSSFEQLQQAVSVSPQPGAQ